MYTSLSYNFNMNYINPQTYLDAVDTVLALDEVPEDALSNLLGGMNSDEYGGYTID